MKKRILSLFVALVLILTAIPVLPIGATQVVTEEWKNGGVSLKDVDAVTDIGYGFKKINVTDARGNIPAPNLDEKPYYLMVGMDGQYPSGHWMQLHLSDGERNSNWNPKGAAADMYIAFPNPNNKNITVFHGGAGETVKPGVPFMPQTAFVFKFAKEKNAEGIDVLTVYCNGVKIFENADQLGVFGGEKLWFTTNANVGANDTLQTYPMLINASSAMSEDPDFYYTTGPKTGCDGYSAYSADVIAENMLALYDDNGYARAIIDSAHNDGGWPERVGESVSTNVSNPNKQIELSVIGDRMDKNNWCVIGIYDPSTGEKSFAQAQNTLRLTINGSQANNRVSYHYLNEDGTKVEELLIIPNESRMNEGELNRVRFELVEGTVDAVNVYYDDVLKSTVLETDPNASGLFDIMSAETLRVGIVGHNNAGTDPYVIRFKANNGNDLNAKLDFDKEVYNVGDYITTTLTLKNNTDRAIQNVKIASAMSQSIVAYENATPFVENIPAGETVEIKQSFRAIEGGRPMLRITASYGDVVAFDAKQFVSVSGAGWYEGDSHSHSKYSDGSGTVAQNAASAYEKGLSWLYSTDHNSISQWQEAAAINEFYKNGDFYNIAGNEFTSCNRGHSLGYRLPYDLGSNYSETENQFNWQVAELGNEGQDWNDIIASVNSKGGFFYVAHPNSGVVASRGAVWTFADVYDVVGIKGIEVWNASENIKHLQNQGALKIWDSLNVRGDKLLGIANSDGHGTSPIGAAHIKGYLESLSQDNINTLLESGSFYGTNGPDLFFEMNGVAMGQTLKISGDTADASITVKAHDDNYPLTKVTLYKLKVTGEISEKAAEIIDYDDGTGRVMDSNLYTDTKEIVKEWDLTGQNLYSFSEVVNLTVSDKDFYRIEVESEKNAFYDGAVAGRENEVGFAYSNPIWVEKAETSNSTLISDIAVTAKNAELKQTANGTYYAQLADNTGFLTADNLSVTVADGVTLVSKKYDSTNKAFNVTVKAQDGTTKTLVIYVVGTVSESKDFWKNGSTSKSADLFAGYSDMGYGFTRLTVSDARGCIDTPNLDEAPYYMMLGMDGLMSGGWAQLHISNGERNPNWNPNNEIYITIPNDSASPRNITVKSETGGAAYNKGVLFIPQTAYIFKFVKEKNEAGNDVLVIYINGQKAFESAEALQVFGGSEVWFKTMGQTGEKDTFTNCPLMINTDTGITEDPDFYHLGGPKGGQDILNNTATWFHVYGLLDENMLALYDENGYSRVVVDSSYNDGGNSAQVGESVTVDMPNVNKEFELSVVGEALNDKNWNIIGIYDPANGIKSFAESENTIRYNINNKTHSELTFYYEYNKAITLIPSAERVVEGEVNKIRFELIEGDVDSINIYYNDNLEKTVLETDENTAGLFALMNSETLRIGVVGHKVNENSDVIKLKVNNTSTSLGSLALNMQSDITVRDIAPEGLRFAADIVGMDTLPEDAVIETGMLIVPTDYLVDGTVLTKESLTTADKKYLDIDCEIWDGTSIKAVISNIKAENTNREFSARAYVKVTFKNGTEKTLYAEQISVGIYAEALAVS